ncbi:thioredoxin family protein [Rufibacter sediminis]|uniref:Thioredoxin family protein n=1 Tax=Rufibacter sediminis TaxID=2762756 RepID=A0ABR6VN62_9BACT|nr:thioredoxin family protein [Rufibacter sediminis]MBC3538342.1 thioredoxin family protein [Rufibacter sediminis]
MNLLIVLLSIFSLSGNQAWLNDIEQAKKISHDSHKYILVNFSGSDWCGPCIKLEKQIFEDPQFQKFAEENLVLLNADFPRLKKNQLDKAQMSLNEKLAEQYNKSGIFPLTLLLDENGKVVKKWEGIPAKDAPAFIAQLKATK